MQIPPLWRRHYRPFYGSVAVGLVITLFVLLVLQGLPFFTRSELSAYDFFMTHRTHRPAVANIVIVELDDASVQDLNNFAYPIPRHYMADAINYLHRAGAQAIGLDFEFLATSTPKDDRALAGAIRRAGNVVTVDVLGGAVASNYVSASTYLLTPIDPIARAAAGLGLANVPLDQDNEVRASDIVQAGPGGTRLSSKLYPTFSLQLASVVLHKPWQDIARGLPQHMLINFVGPQDPGNASQQTLLHYQFENLVTPPLPPAQLFRNRIVLIIPYATVTKDLLQTPYGTMYGGSVQANALNTILDRYAFLPIGADGNTLIILIVGILTTLAASRFGIWRSTLATLSVAAGYALLAFVLFDRFRVWLHLVTPEIAVILAFAAIMALRFATEEQQKRRTKRIFGEYVKPEIVDILVNAADEEAALAGARRPITVLFVDVRGFTAMSEQMEPEQVVSTLDIYLEELTGSVTAYDGTLDKYVGDEIMAIWNAPHFQDDHPLRAVLTGLDMIARLDSINAQLTDNGLRPIAYGVGINTGDAVVGRMGSKVRKQYDVIGDAINTGARLCSAAGGGEIIIGESTWELIGDELVVEETEPLRLKGKSRPFRTFRVLGLRVAEERVGEPAPAPA